MRLILICITFLSATIISVDPSTQSLFIVWNIGQGQWTTLISDQYCDHYDIGGDTDVSKKVIKICGNRTHRVHLSHWDMDHIGLIKKLKARTSKICLWNIPLGKTSLRKWALVSDLKRCTLNRHPYTIIYKGSLTPHAAANDTSEVIAAHQILVPGDSPIKEEKIWSKNLSSSKIKGLVLGHHGSRTSTSDLLLQHLPNLQWAVASARKSRYGHPHIETLIRLKKNKTPVLLTEDWGSIGFEI